MPVFGFAKLCLAAAEEGEIWFHWERERYATLMLHLFCQMCCRSDPITAFIMLVVSPGFDLSEQCIPPSRNMLNSNISSDL